MINFNKMTAQVKNLLSEGKLEAAERLLKSSIDPDELSNPNYLESVFLLYLFLGDSIRHFMKNLKVTKVPPKPLDTQTDEGRRFFYALYILNRSGGMRLVRPYLEDINVHRLLEHRFLGGMYFYNYDFINSRKCYVNAFNNLPQSYTEIDHLLILGNMGACSLYLGDYENYHHSRMRSLEYSHNHDSVKRVYSKYDLYMNLQKRDNEGINQSVSILEKHAYKYRNNEQPFERVFIDMAIATAKNDVIIYETKLKEYNLLYQKQIRRGLLSPERYFALSMYLSSLCPFGEEIWGKYFDFKTTTYPLPRIEVMGMTLNDDHFTSYGNHEAKSYINLTTQEYSINDIRGIGLSNELKAIYYLARADKYGLSFETLASLIYEHDDYSGLFLIKERIKQIVHRIKNHYHIAVKSKNYRAYIDLPKACMIFVVKKGPLRVMDNFTIENFMVFYDVSQSKAKKQIKRLKDQGLISKRTNGRKNIYVKKA